MGVPHNLRAGPQPTTIEDALRRALEARPSPLRSAQQDRSLDFFNQLLQSTWLEYQTVSCRDLHSPGKHLITEQSSSGSAHVLEY
jgi:hypothetical protein